MRAGATLTRLDLRRATGEDTHAGGEGGLRHDSPPGTRRGQHSTRRRGGRSPNEGPHLGNRHTTRSLSPALWVITLDPPGPPLHRVSRTSRAGTNPQKGTANNGNKPRAPQASKAEHRRRQRERETPPPTQKRAPRKSWDAPGAPRGSQENEARAHRPGAARDTADEPPSAGSGKGAQGATRAEQAHTEHHAPQRRVRGHRAQAGEPHPCLPHTTTDG